MEAFLTSNSVQFEHHDLATDRDALEYLRAKGITTAPVTIVDDEVIIGYYPKKLISSLKLNVKVDLGANVDWLATKYDIVLSAAIRAVRQLSDTQLGKEVTWRPQTLGQHMLHVLSFPALALRSAEHGSMSLEDMRASTEALEWMATVEAICRYGEQVRSEVASFLTSRNTDAFERVVNSHYGGEVTVLDLMTIILRHSTHHLKQAYHFMENNLGVSLKDPATDADLEGIATPTELF